MELTLDVIKPEVLRDKRNIHQLDLMYLDMTYFSCCGCTEILKSVDWCLSSDLEKSNTFLPYFLSPLGLQFHMLDLLLVVFIFFTVFSLNFFVQTVG